MKEPALLLGISWGKINQNLCPAQQWIIDFTMDGGIVFPDGRDECLLEIENYEPYKPWKSQMVTATLKRNDGKIIWRTGFNNALMPARPTLVWSEALQE